MTASPTRASERLRLLAEDKVTRISAALLASVYVLTGAAWFTTRGVTALVTGEDAVCWPLAPGCEAIRAHLSPRLAGALVVTFMALGAASAFSFLERRARRGRILYILAGTFGLGIYALDYRLRLDQTMMFGWASVVFFVAPRPKEALQLLLPLFYAWAGTLKLNAEWMSGAALYAKPLFLPAALVPASCVYVVFLELVLVWGLFARDHRIRYFVYAQLCLFHLVSFSVVGWFYPLMMFALTAVYPLSWHFDSESLVWSRVRVERSMALVIAVGFSLCQLLPFFYAGDTAITGEGRLFALHMFDARVVCEGGATLTRRTGDRSRAVLINDHLDVRTRCDPVVLGATTQRLCRLIDARDGAGATRIDVAIDARRTSERELRPLLHLDDACAQDLSYSILHHNAWISR